MSRPTTRPAGWSPPRAPTPRAGPMPAPPVELVPVGGTGPEDVVVDADGRLYTGVEDGRILRVDADGRRAETVADTGGRPLGVELAGDGRLVVCDARRGLLRVDPERQAVETLVERVGGEKLRFCDNAAVASDGTVFFSDASRRFGIDHWRRDILEHVGTGRLLRRDPGGGVKVLLDGLQFANGVALAPDESFVAVAETGACRIVRLWLAGPRAGRRDVLVDDLPGFPDNLSTGSNGVIWVALPSPRDVRLELLHRLHPLLRRAASAVPAHLQPDPPPAAARVLGVDGAGRVVRDLRDRGGRYRMVTGVREHAGKLYLGSLVERALAVLALA